MPKNIYLDNAIVLASFSNINNYHFPFDTVAKLNQIENDNKIENLVMIQLIAFYKKISLRFRGIDSNFFLSSKQALRLKFAINLMAQNGSMFTIYEKVTFL